MPLQYGFFYPENGQRVLSDMTFTSVDEAKAYWADKRSSWQEIPAVDMGNGRDKAAYLSPYGHIVVVREIVPLALPPASEG